MLNNYTLDELKKYTETLNQVEVCEGRIQYHYRLIKELEQEIVDYKKLLTSIETKNYDRHDFNSDDIPF